MKIHVTGARSPNDRLREAMRASGVSFAELADATGVHLKTAQRWVYEGRRPRARPAEKVAALFGVPVGHLFIGAQQPLSDPDLVEFYQAIETVPDFLWRELAEAASAPVQIVCASPPMLPGSLGDVLRRRALGERLRVQVVIGHDSPVVLRGAGVAVRRSHGSPMSLYRFADQMLVWLNRGAPGAPWLGPVLHLRQSEAKGAFYAYTQMISRVWSEALPVDAEPSDDYILLPDYG